MNAQEKMIEYQLKPRGIDDERVLRAMAEVDRTKFVPDEIRDMAYADSALPIGKDQTISQPYIVAYMAQILETSPDHTVLEIGTGCGYNAAVLSRISRHVFSIEIVEWLGHLARKNLNKAGIKNVTTMIGDGYRGWPQNAPFDRIVLTAAAPVIPEPLKKQLRVGGRIVGPISDSMQQIILLEKTGENEFQEHDLIHVRFVPMTGESEKH